MIMNDYELIIGIVLFAAGFAIAYWIRGKIVSQKVKAAEREASRILEDSERKAETVLKEADLEVKDRLFKMKSDFDTETKETRSELKKREMHLIQKEENIDRKMEQFEKRDHELSRKEKGLTKREGKLQRKELEAEELIEEQKMQLERISGLATGMVSPQNSLCSFWILWSPPGTLSSIIFTASGSPVFAFSLWKRRPPSRNADRPATQ